LISHAKAPLGFLNPLIYASTSASAFNDIKSGSNPGCGTQGFSAVVGWDPVRIVLSRHLPWLTVDVVAFVTQVTGLGTPDFLKLQTIV